MNGTKATANLTLGQQRDAERIIRRGGLISIDDYKITVGVLCGVASLLCLGRIVMRVSSRKHISLDDAVIIFACLCLVVSTVLCYKTVYYPYLWLGLNGGDRGVMQLAVEKLRSHSQEARNDGVYWTLLWIAVCAVKFSYLALFHCLLRGMGHKVRWFYWSCVVVTTATLLFGAIGMQVVVCPRSSHYAGDCIPHMRDFEVSLSLLFWVITGLDWVTDIAIISIPLLILRQSQMQMITKIGLSVFLCLSIFMLICTVIRVAGLTGTYNLISLDFPWNIFWLHVEACIGVIMASITTFRSALVGSSDAPNKLQMRLFSWVGKDMGEEAFEKGDVRSGYRLHGVQIPQAALTGLRTALSLRVTTRMTESNVSGISDVGAINVDYHVYIRHQSSSGSEKTSGGQAGGPEAQPCTLPWPREPLSWARRMPA